jgi:hypothetical protein
VLVTNPAVTDDSNAKWERHKKNARSRPVAILAKVILSDCRKWGEMADRKMTSLREPAAIVSLKEFLMSRRLLLQSVMGHLSLLEQKHPRKANSAIAKRTRKYIAKLRKAA